MTMIRLEPPAKLDMNIGEVMFSQRAIRKLKPDPISDEDIKTILDSASKAPNGANQQPCRFLVIKDRNKISEFGKLYHEAWWAKRWDEHQWTKREDIPKEDKTHHASMQLADEMKNAPLVILVFSTVPNKANSIFPAVQNLLLSARALGIGSTLTALHAKVMDRVYDTFKIPKNMELHCCIPLGYPRGKFGPTQRKPTAETTYYNEWNSPPPWA
jgi:nitroreductase